jgi:hypothetical protein
VTEPVLYQIQFETVEVTPCYDLLLRAAFMNPVVAAIVQDWSLQCPSNAIWTFKIYLSQNNPSKRNPKLKMKMSLEVLNIITQTSNWNWRCHLKSSI